MREMPTKVHAFNPQFAILHPHLFGAYSKLCLCRVSTIATSISIIIQLVGESTIFSLSTLCIFFSLKFLLQNLSTVQGGIKSRQRNRINYKLKWVQFKIDRIVHKRKKQKRKTRKRERERVENRKSAALKEKKKREKTRRKKCSTSSRRKRSQSRRRGGIVKS